MQPAERPMLLVAVVRALALEILLAAVLYMAYCLWRIF